MTDVAVIDAGGANFGSVCYALERVGARPRIVRDADGLRGMPRVLLPGVGAAAPAMALLRERGIGDVLRRLEAPLLGICLGMQLLFDGSEEGDVACLGLLPGRVRKLQVWKNPVTGEVLETKSGNNKKLKAWKEEYGEKFVSTWLQKD